MARRRPSAFEVSFPEEGVQGSVPAGTASEDTDSAPGGIGKRRNDALHPNNRVSRGRALIEQMNDRYPG